MTHNMKFRKVASVAAVFTLAAAGLAACSGSGKDSGSASGSDEKVTIEYLHRLPDGEGMTKSEDIVKRWNDEHPNIQVKSTKFDGKPTELIKKLERDVANDSAPCLAQIGYGEVPDVFAKGLLQDVTKEANKYRDHFSNAFVQMSVGDKVVGLPQDTGPLVYYYDAAEFEALGLKVPTTLDELKETAKAAAAKGKYILDFVSDEAGYWLSAQATSIGDPWYSADGDKWKVETAGEGAQKVAAFWQELLDANAVLKINRWDDAYTKALTDKQLIGNIGAAWESGFMLDGVVPEGQDGTWKVALLPDFGSGVKTGPDGGSGVAVTKSCKFPEQALEFADWFNTQNNDLASQGLIVAAKGDVTTPEKIKKQFSGQDVFAEMSKANDTLNPDFIYIPGYPSVAEVMVKTAADVAEGKAKVMDIFTKAQEQSVKALKDLNLPVAE